MPRKSPFPLIVKYVLIVELVNKGIIRLHINSLLFAYFVDDVLFKFGFQERKMIIRTRFMWMLVGPQRSGKSTICNKIILSATHH
jgi:hypothetical protein